MTIKQDEDFGLPESPVRWSWKVYLAVTLNSASVLTKEVSEYLTDVVNLLIKDYEARRQDEVRLELESFDEEN